MRRVALTGTLPTLAASGSLLGPGQSVRLLRRMNLHPAELVLFALGLRATDSAWLFADAQLPDHIPVAVGIVCFQIVEQAAALAYQHQ